MKNSNTDFILSEISSILKNVTAASAGVGSGIETYPLCDYVMQSTFLKMTGFHEQKMKCICWELAANDYQYRYDFTKTPLGECSRYEDKQNVYKDIIKEIIKRKPEFSITGEINKPDILASTTSIIQEVFLDTNLAIWAQNSYNSYEVIWHEVKRTHFANENNSLFTAVNNGISLRLLYDDHLYRHRNRCAHNTLSYQQNLPTLKTLIDEKYKYENYFLYFAILVLMDKIFIALYNKYLYALEE